MRNRNPYQRFDMVVVLREYHRGGRDAFRGFVAAVERERGDVVKHARFAERRGIHPVQCETQAGCQRRHDLRSRLPAGVVR